MDPRGEGCPLVRRGQPLGRQRGIDPADDPGDGTHLAGDRQGELPGPAAKVDDDVVTGQAEGIEERTDHGRRVAAPVLVIETGDLAAETKVFAHPSRVNRRRSAAVAVQRTAYQLDVIPTSPRLWMTGTPVRAR